MGSSTERLLNDERLLNEQYESLVERTATSLPDLQAQLDAIEELEQALQPPSESPKFVVAATSTGR